MCILINVYQGVVKCVQSCSKVNFITNSTRIHTFYFYNNKHIFINTDTTFTTKHTNFITKVPWRDLSVPHIYIYIYTYIRLDFKYTRLLRKLSLFINCKKRTLYLLIIISYHEKCQITTYKLPHTRVRSLLQSMKALVKHEKVIFNCF